MSSPVRNGARYLHQRKKNLGIPPTDIADENLQEAELARLCLSKKSTWSVSASARPRQPRLPARTAARPVRSTDPSLPSQKSAVLALALTGAAAYVAPVGPARASVAVNGKEELVALAESNPDKLGQALGAARRRA